MSWYRDIDKSKDLNYTAPKVAEQKLDAGGNYVSLTQDGTTSSGGLTGNRPLDSGSIIE
jgi:hypothetical protein